jgi:hypothetical protein
MVKLGKPGERATADNVTVGTVVKHAGSPWLRTITEVNSGNGFRYVLANWAKSTASAWGDYGLNYTIISQPTTNTDKEEPTMNRSELGYSERVQLGYSERMRVEMVEDELKKAIKKHGLCADGVKKFQDAVNNRTGIKDYLTLIDPPKMDRVTVTVEMEVPQSWTPNRLDARLRDAVSTHAGAYRADVTPTIKVNVNREPNR